MRDIIGAICAGICLFIAGFMLLLGAVMIIALIAAPANAGSLPQVPGVVLDDTYAPSAKAKAPPGRPAS